METLLPDIEAFMKRHELAATAFGDGALGDRHFVRQLRGGRRVWPETEKKVRAFMEEYAEAAGNRGADAPAKRRESAAPARAAA